MMLSTGEKSASFRGGLQPRPTDVFIALMGVTGAGKSSFISLCCDEDVPIGTTLQACTSTVTVYPCSISDTTTVYLVDTPGFDDTNRSDTEVLRELATWLADSYTAKINLSGIIYLHRISDIRMQGSAKKNLYMFKKLCGNEALRKVILGTTMWSKVSQAEGTARELELTSTADFWGWMISKGSKVLRHTGDKESALRLIQVLLKDPSHITLDLQQQMVDEKKDLGDTNAGKEVQAEIIKERRKAEKAIAEIQEEYKEALQARAIKAAEALAEVRQDYSSKIAQLDTAFERIKISTEKLIEEKYEKMMREQEARHEKDMLRLQHEKTRQGEYLRREKQTHEDALGQREREAAVHQEGLSRLETRDKLAKTPKFTSNTTSDFSLAIHGENFYFRGPKFTLWEWQLPDGELNDLSSKQFQVVAVGQSQEMVTISRSGKAEYAGHFGIAYPRMAGRYSAKDLDAARQVVLGCNGHYFIRGQTWTRYYLNQEIISHARIHENHAIVDVCALGRSGAYVVQLSTGALFWNLKEQYSGLQRKIEEDVKPDRKRFAALTLSLTDESYFALFKRPDSTKATSYWLKGPTKALQARWIHWADQELGTV